MTKFVIKKSYHLLHFTLSYLQVGNETYNMHTRDTHRSGGILELNKNTLGVKKVWGQEGVLQVCVTKNSDIRVFGHTYLQYSFLASHFFYTQGVFV